MNKILLKRLFVGVASCLVAVQVMAVTFSPLLTPEAAYHGASHLAILDSDDLTETTSGTAQTITVFNVESKIGAELIISVLKTPFEDASDTNLNITTIEVGDGNDPNRYLTSIELNDNGTEIPLAYGTGSQLAYTADDTVDIIFTSNTNKIINNIDTGELWLYFRVHDAR